MGYVDVVLRDAPSVYWRLGEPSGLVGADSSGNGRSLTINAVSAFSRPGAIPGDANTGMATNGGDPIGTVADAAWHRFTGSYTIELWARWSSITAARRLIWRAQSCIVLINYASSAKISFYTDSGSSDANRLEGTASATLADNAYHHIVLVRDASGSPVVKRIVVDGVLLAEANELGGGPADVAATFQISHTTTSFLGDLDEVAIYPTAFSVDKAKAHFKAAQANAVVL